MVWFCLGGAVALAIIVALVCHHRTVDVLQEDLLFVDVESCDVGGSRRVVRKLLVGEHARELSNRMKKAYMCIEIQCRNGDRGWILYRDDHYALSDW